MAKRSAQKASQRGESPPKSAKSQKKTIQAHKPEQKGSGFNAKTFLFAAGGVIVAIGLIAVVLSGTGDSDSEAADAEVTVTGETLPPFNAAEGNDVAAGLPAPAVEGADFSGTPVSIDTANGKPKMVVFLAHWCPHCQREVPQVQAWVDQNGLPDDVELISVTTSISRFRENYPPSEWLEGEGWTVPLIVDDADNSVYTAYGSLNFPGWAFIDADGNIVTRATGEGVVDIDQVVTALQTAEDTDDAIGESTGATATGTVIDLQGDLENVESFTILSAGEELIFVPAPGATFHGSPLSHLSELIASGVPVVVDYVVLEDGTLQAIEVLDFSEEE